jgi:hypothetical protein
VSVRASTWWAAPIDKFDTIDATFTAEHGLPLRVLMTHASTQCLHPQVYIHACSGSWDWPADENQPLSCPRRVDSASQPTLTSR